MWRINLFGTIEIEAPSGRTIRIFGKKAAELLGFLAIRRNAVVDRDTVAAALWPEADELTGRNRLKQTLAVLRREVEGVPLRIQGKNEIGIAAELVEVDYHRLDQRLKWYAVLPPNKRPEAARQLLEAFQQGLMVGLAGDWLQGERLRIEGLCRELAAESHGSPSTANVTFRFTVLPGDPQIPVVGRREELFQIRTWLRENRGRRLWIAGAPGIGKTRLLKEILDTSRHVADMAIEISAAHFTEESWAARFSQALGIENRNAFRGELKRLLLSFDRPLLAVDGIDEAGPELIAWIDGLMDAAPNLRLLATSRYNPEAPDVQTVELLPGTLLTLPADLLFRFAESLGVPEQTLTEGRQALVEVSHRLGHWALALEVAAGMLQFMSPQALRERTRSDLGFVVSEPTKACPSLLDSVRTIRDGLDAAVQESHLLAATCMGLGDEMCERLMGAGWQKAIRVLLDRHLLCRVDGLAGPRFMVPRPSDECVRLIEPPERRRMASERYAAACLELALAIAVEVDEGDRQRWIRLLHDEAPNLLSAAVRFPSGQFTAAISMLKEPFELVGEGRSVAEILQRGAPMPDGLDPGHLKVSAGWTSLFQGETEAAAHCFEEASQLFKQQGKQKSALRWKEIALKTRGESLEQLLPEAERLEDHHLMGLIFLKRAEAAHGEGRMFDAAAFAERAVEAFRRTGETVTLYDALNALVTALKSVGAPQEQIDVLAEEIEPLLDYVHNARSAAHEGDRS